MKERYQNMMEQVKLSEAGRNAIAQRLTERTTRARKKPLQWGLAAASVCLVLMGGVFAAGKEHNGAGGMIAELTDGHVFAQFTHGQIHAVFKKNFLCGQNFLFLALPLHEKIKGKGIVARGGAIGNGNGHKNPIRCHKHQRKRKTQAEKPLAPFPAQGRSLRLFGGEAARFFAALFGKTALLARRKRGLLGGFFLRSGFCFVFFGCHFASSLISFF